MFRVLAFCCFVVATVFAFLKKGDYALGFTAAGLSLMTLPV